MFRPFLRIQPEPNRERSEVLANLDAIFFLPEARCLHQGNCGEAFQPTVEMDRNPDGTSLCCLADLADATILRRRGHIKV